MVNGVPLQAEATNQIAWMTSNFTIFTASFPFFLTVKYLSASFFYR